MRNDSAQRDFADRWDAWHRDLEARRARPLGFLAITALHWLSDEPQRFRDVPGAWSTSGNGVHLQLDAGEKLVVDGVVVQGDHLFDGVDETGVEATFGDAVVEIARRDGGFMLRPRHPDNPVRTSYVGTPSYPASMDWVFEGRFVPTDVSRPVTVDTTVEGLEHVYESPGEIEFTLAGQLLRLVAFNGEDTDEFFIVFTDLTARTTTYAACRFLDVRGPGPDGSVTIDFNRARNPPCAYTAFATCPLPPAQNHLPVRVDAGEQLPHE